MSRVLVFVSPVDLGLREFILHNYQLLSTALTLEPYWRGVGGEKLSVILTLNLFLF